VFQSLYSPAVAESLTVVLVGLEPESTSLSLSFLLGQDYHVFRVAVPQRVGYTEITLQENGYSVERGAMRKDFDEVSSFVAALQQEDLIQTGNTSNWMDPLRLKLASSSIRRGLRLLVPDGLRGLIENSALLSTLADQADFVFVAGPVNASIPEKEQSLLKTLISRSNGFLAIFTDDQTTPPAPASGWNQSMGVSMLPPIFTSSVANQVRSSEILNRLTSENSELRLALIETRKRVQVESALLLLEDSLVRQVSQFRNRKRLMMGGLVNRPDEDQHLRAISEELRTRLQEDVESLRRKIEESAKLALLNEGAAYQILKQTMDSIAPMDLEQVNKGNIIQLSLTDEAAGKFRNVLIELGHNRLNDDLRLVHETLDNTNEELSRRLGETTGSILRLPIDFPDHKKFWDSVVALSRPELKYKGQLPQVTFMDRLNQARQPLMMVMMSVMIFGGMAFMMNGEKGKETLQAYAGFLMLPVFITGLIWTFVSFKRRQLFLMDKEIDKLREGVFQELRKILADIIREEQGLLNHFFQQTSRNLGQQIQLQIQQFEQQKRKTTDSQRQQAAEQSRNIDDRIRQLEAQRAEVQNLVRGLDRVRLELSTKITELSRQAASPAANMKT